VKSPSNLSLENKVIGPENRLGWQRLEGFFTSFRMTWKSVILKCNTV